MISIVLALGAALGWGISDYLGGQLSRRTVALAVLGVSQALGFVVAIAAAIVLGLDDPVPVDLAYAAASGVTLAVGLGALYRAMTVGTMAIVAPIAAAGTAIPVVFGLLTGDGPTRLQQVGLAAAVLGIGLCSWQRMPADARGNRVAGGVGLALVAAVCGGLTAIALTKASPGGVVWVLLVQRATVALLALGLLALLPGIGIRLPRSVLPAVAAVGLFDLVATALFSFASIDGPISLIATVGALYPVFTVGLAYVLLSERLAAHQVVGAVAALAGVAAIAGGAG